MDDMLKKFLEEGERLFEFMPVYFFPNPKSSSGNDGIVEMYFTQWAYFQGLLKVTDASLDACFSKSDNLKERLRLVRKVLGEEMLPSRFNREGFEFAKGYYNPGWMHFYFSDFASIFPGVERFEFVPDSEGNYKAIEALLNQRFEEWKSQSSIFVEGLVETTKENSNASVQEVALDKDVWISRMNEALRGPRDQKSALHFHDLIYQAPVNGDSDIVDMLMKSFLTPFDSSVMAGCVTVLSGFEFDVYYDAYFKILPQLLEKDANVALGLMDYPGYELDERHIEHIIGRLHGADLSDKLKKSLIHQMAHWNLTDEEPWSSIYDSRDP
jgi:hypothetical protein